MNIEFFVIFGNADPIGENAGINNKYGTIVICFALPSRLYAMGFSYVDSGKDEAPCVNSYDEKKHGTR